MRTPKTLLAILICGGAFAPAQAQEKPERRVLFELTLDIDRDGRMDRAVLVGGGKGSHLSDNTQYLLTGDESVDLYVYLGEGEQKLDLSRPPSLLKRDITSSERNPWVYPLKSKGGRSLIISAGYNLYGNETIDRLTIAHRGGQFIVAGFSHGFERRDGKIGDCDINFLTGKGVTSKGLNGKKKSIAEKFAPVRLADWSIARVKRACGF